MRLTFRGQTALVLGASSQIGLALTRLLLAEDLDVITTSASLAGQTILAEHFPDQSCFVLDLGAVSPDVLRPVVGKGLDYFVDLGHGDHEGLLAATTETRAEAYFQAHVSGRLRLLKAVTRSMLPRRFGRLIHVSSTAADLPAPGQGFYSAAKRAAEAFYLGLGLELNTQGISSLNLRLGLVDAGRGQRFLDKGDNRGRLGHKIVSLEQAASTLLFLLSDQALALTCTTVTMDAGLTAQKYA